MCKNKTRLSNFKMKLRLSYFHDFLRIPHGVFEGFRHALLASLTEKFEVDGA